MRLRSLFKLRSRPSRPERAERARQQQAAERQVLEHKREAWRWTDNQAFKRLEP